jgi:protein-disulfide isomerase
MSKIIIALLILVVLCVAIDALLFYGLVRQQTNTNTSSPGNVATTDDPYAGDPNAKVVVVEFSDFQCPYCSQEFPTVRELINVYKNKIKFIYRDFPVSDKHPNAQKAAEAADCAFAQGKFWEMHDKLFINQSDLSNAALKRYAGEIGLDAAQFNSCLDSGTYASEVQKDFNDGYAAGVQGTPTFFINDRKFEGVVSLDTFKQIIDQLLAIYGVNS